MSRFFPWIAWLEPHLSWTNSLNLGFSWVEYLSPRYFSRAEYFPKSIVFLLVLSLGRLFSPVGTSLLDIFSAGNLPWVSYSPKYLPWVKSSFVRSVSSQSNFPRVLSLFFSKHNTSPEYGPCTIFSLLYLSFVKSFPQVFPWVWVVFHEHNNFPLSPPRRHVP